MKKILVLMITFVFCGGCGDNSTGSKQANPLVGIWEREIEAFEDESVWSVFFIFYDDGRFKWTVSEGSGTLVIQGTWEKKSSIELILRLNEATLDGENQSMENTTLTVDYSLGEDRLTMVVDGESLVLSRA